MSEDGYNRALHCLEMTLHSTDKMRPVHPGEILRDDVLAPLGMSARQFALALGVPANRISQILATERAVTADTALRLGRLLGSKPDFWLGICRFGRGRRGDFVSRA